MKHGAFARARDIFAVTFVRSAGLSARRAILPSRGVAPLADARRVLSGDAISRARAIRERSLKIIKIKFPVPLAVAPWRNVRNLSPRASRPRDPRALALVK